MSTETEVQTVDGELVTALIEHTYKLSDLTGAALNSLRSPQLDPNTTGDLYDRVLHHTQHHLTPLVDRWQGTQRTQPPSTQCFLSLDSNTVGYLLRLLSEHRITRDDGYQPHAEARNTLHHAHTKAVM